MCSCGISTSTEAWTTRGCDGRRQLLQLTDWCCSVSVHEPKGTAVQSCMMLAAAATPNPTSPPMSSTTRMRGHFHFLFCVRLYFAGVLSLAFPRKRFLFKICWARTATGHSRARKNEKNVNSPNKWLLVWLGLSWAPLSPTTATGSIKLIFQLSGRFAPRPRACAGLQKYALTSRLCTLASRGGGVCVRSLAGVEPQRGPSAGSEAELAFRRVPGCTRWGHAHADSTTTASPPSRGHRL